MSDLIYSVDEPDGTFYVLIRNGHTVAACHWPHPLELAYPDARRAGTLGCENMSNVVADAGEDCERTRTALYSDLAERLKFLK